jgi:hypothetical protein
LQPKEGLDAVDVVERVASSNPEVAEFHFARRDDRGYLPSERLPRSIVDSAVRLRERYGIPFWEAVLISVENMEPKDAEQVLDVALFHEPVQPTITLSAAEVAGGSLRSTVSRLGPNKALDLTSTVRTRQGELAQLPLLDFRLKASPNHESVAAAISRRIVGDIGYLLESGESYHFIGLRPQSADSWIKMMGRSLLFGPHIDARWVAHQLIDGSGALRVSPSAKHPFVPRAVRSIS